MLLEECQQYTSVKKEVSSWAIVIKLYMTMPYILKLEPGYSILKIHFKK